MTPSLDARRPFTPDELAKRWSCSAEAVRNLVKQGRWTIDRVRICAEEPL